jgi:peroxiredoxin Q/BCP
LADYRDHHEEIRAAGAEVAAASVDPPEKSEALRRELRLPFPILCDTERRVVKTWDIYNPRERGGIAKPSVFVIGSDGVVRYSKVDSVANRIPPSEIIRILRTSEGPPARTKTYIPNIGEFYNAIRRLLRG